MELPPTPNGSFVESTSTQELLGGFRVRPGPAALPKEEDGAGSGRTACDGSKGFSLRIPWP
jgi:hypothetical protein